MQHFSRTFFTVFIFLCSVRQNIQAMVLPLYKSIRVIEDQSGNGANRKIRKHFFKKSNLEEFLNYGTISNGRTIQDIFPDEYALKSLKPATENLVCRFDEGIFSLSELNVLLRPRLKEIGLKTFYVTGAGRPCNGRDNDGIYVVALKHDEDVLKAMLFGLQGEEEVITSVLWHGFDLVGEENVAAKIILLKLLKRGDREAVQSKKHLKKVFATFSPLAQKFLDRSYDIIQKPKKCAICYSGKYADEVMHPACCRSKQTLCLTCYERILNSENEEYSEDSDDEEDRDDEDRKVLCPFCRSKKFDPIPELVQAPVSIPRRIIRACTTCCCTIQ
jgi:hypothetical protein